MFGTMDFCGAVVLFLIMLPAALIGFVAGALVTRSGYLPRLRRERIEKKRAYRYAEQWAKNERYLGYAVGYREGSRNA